MIEFQNVSKRLGNFKLKDVSIQIPEGYICGLVGRNGAGKTSLLHLLLGLYRPGQGTITVDGFSYEENEKEIHDRMGAVLSEDLLRGELSLKKNGKNYGRYFSGFDETYYNSLLEKFALEKKEKFGRLSKGQKLKAQFAFALACHPKYLILDEPTANFDPEFRKDFLKIIQEFVSSGKRSVILATHLTEDLDRLADYLIYLDEGNVIFSDDMETFRETYRIAIGEKYKLKLLGRDEVIYLQERAYDCRALIRYRLGKEYDKSLTLACPSIEEFMYFYSKRGEVW